MLSEAMGHKWGMDRVKMGVSEREQVSQER
jgi:hypothetical protein